MYSLWHFVILLLLAASCEMVLNVPRSEKYEEKYENKIKNVDENDNEENNNNNVNRDPETDSAFRNASIVPDFLIESPVRTLNVSYDLADVELGNFIFPTKTVLPPTLNYTAEQNTLFTFLIANLDNPSPAAPVLSSYIISLTVNIRGTNTSSGEVIARYAPISPQPGSGCHRIVCLLLRQSEKINTNDLELLTLGVYRWRFSIETFKKIHKIAELYAGNYFLTEIPKNYADFC